MEKLTPMMRQYLEIKENHKDCILFFRLGDFYEMFFEDAVTASEILDITLTGKACGLKERAPMCGIPYHSSQGYIQKLILAGKKVAVCEQVEDPSQAKGIVKREVVKIVTPGTIIDEDIIDREKNNYLLSFLINNTNVDISYIDISTGELSTTVINKSELSDLFFKINPSEIITNASSKEILDSDLDKNIKLINSYISENNIIMNISEELIDESWLLNNKLDTNISLSLYKIFRYINHTQKSINLNMTKKDNGEALIIDHFTLKNLEIIETIRRSKKKGSLFWVLDDTKTAMGARMLKNWLLYPLKNETLINSRLNYIDLFFQNTDFTLKMRNILNHISDLERICQKLSYDSIKTDDILRLKESTSMIIELKKFMAMSEFELLRDFYLKIPDLECVFELIDSSIINKDFNSKEKYIIKSSFNDELSELRNLIDHSAEMILGVEQREKLRTGIKTLKIGYNKVFGYYIEITHANLKNFDIPSDYIRKQTLTNGERFISEELKLLEEKILTAKDKADSLEKHIFENIKMELKNHINNLLSASKVVAILDCYQSLATVANNNNFVRPEINNKGYIKLENGRHPVIEKMTSDYMFVPNDTTIEDGIIQIITGPNMAGKSTYMRQVAIIVLLAHIGSFVPCSKAEICLIDRIFTRIGASDDLSQGQSTFMVEMIEVANILQNASSNSFIILDEIGRGTSTYDGMSIAFAVIKYIEDQIKAKTLVSTHYHEITSLEDSSKNIQNYSMLVEEVNDNVNFLRKIVKGKADKSYGIHVAMLANLPSQIIDLAQDTLESLESNVSVYKPKSQSTKKSSEVENHQLSLEQYFYDNIISEIKTLDLNNTTPLEALTILNNLKNKLG